VDGFRAARKEKAAKSAAEDVGDEYAPPSYVGEDTYELVVCHGNVIRWVDHSLKANPRVKLPAWRA
jgi:hypothetical protein